MITEEPEVHEPTVLEQVQGIVERVTRGQLSKWNSSGRWVEFDDVWQEGWLAYYAHKGEIDALIEDGRCGQAWYLIRDDVYRYCRREKAQRGGYDPGDEYFYTLRALKAWLPSAFAGDVASEAGSSFEQRTKRSGASNSGSDTDTTLVDIRWGLGQLTQESRDVLFHVYGRPEGPDSVPARKALKLLQQALGGPSAD